MREGNSFSLFILAEEGYPISDLDRGGTPSQVQTGEGYPILLMGGYPIKDQDGGYLGWVPTLSKIGWGTPPIQTWDGGVPPSRPGMGGTPIQDWMGYPPCPRLDGVFPPSAKQALATRQAVCLLHSRRRTFLFLESERANIRNVSLDT